MVVARFALYTILIQVWIFYIPYKSSNIGCPNTTDFEFYHAGGYYYPF